MIKTSAVVATVLAFAAPWHSGTAQTTPDRYRQKLQPVLEKLIQQQELPGFAIGVVEDNRIVYAAGFGVRNVTRKTMRSRRARCSTWPPSPSRSSPRRLCSSSRKARSISMRQW